MSDQLVLARDGNGDTRLTTKQEAENNGWQIITEIKHVEKPANDKMRRPTETK